MQVTFETVLALMENFCFRVENATQKKKLWLSNGLSSALAADFPVSFHTVELSSCASIGVVANNMN